jgi:uncharacterized protein YbjT (DUF2867 family)
MRRVLVAGATGYLGGFVCREYKKRGWYVRALARPGRNNAALEKTADEIFEAEITRPETLDGICEGMDSVFSSVGITRQKDGLTFRDVDYRGNRNLLQAAMQASVRKFVYVSVFKGPALRRLDIVAAHEDFVDSLKASGIGYAVVRPTGYFSDMGEILDMARRGRVWLIGSGATRVNPIHGADLAVVCADALEGGAAERDAGGPRVLTWNEVAAAAFEAVGKPVRVSHVPGWLMRAATAGVRLFSRHRGELMAFFTLMATVDMVAPSTGTRTLGAYYRALAGNRDAG